MIDNFMLLEGKAIIREDVFRCDILSCIDENKCTFVDFEAYDDIIDCKDAWKRLEWDIYKDNSKVQVGEYNFWEKLTEKAFFSLLNNMSSIDSYEMNSKQYLSIQDIDNMSNKLLKYCLNTEHEKGKHKAKVFYNVLGFNIENYHL